MKAYWESGGMSPRILKLGTRWRWVVSFKLRSLYPQGKSPRYPLDVMVTGRSGEDKKSLSCYHWDSKLGSPAHNLANKYIENNV
jgi:hypothetical protein